jgi:hypothetical protein
MDSRKRSDCRAEPRLRLLNFTELAGTFRQISGKYSVSQLDELGDQRFSGNVKRRFLEATEKLFFISQHGFAGHQKVRQRLAGLRREEEQR